MVSKGSHFCATITWDLISARIACDATMTWDHNARMAQDATMTTDYVSERMA
jgi:hypothetical protein